MNEARDLPLDAKIMLLGLLEEYLKNDNKPDTAELVGAVAEDLYRLKELEK